MYMNILSHVYIFMHLSHTTLVNIQYPLNIILYVYCTILHHIHTQITYTAYAVHAAYIHSTSVYT